VARAAVVTVAAVLLAAGGAMAEDWSPLWTTAKLSQGRENLVAASAGGKVFFGGGQAYGGVISRVDIFDAATLTRSTASLSEARYSLSATSADGKIFFGGGYNGGYPYSKVVDIFDAATLTRTSTSLSLGRGALSATAVDGKVFFGGGNYGSITDTVDVFDTATLTRSTASLSVARSWLAATSAGGKAFFGGGQLSGTNPYSSAVDIFDPATLARTTASLSVARDYLAATSAGGKVFFGGGACDWPSYVSDVVDIFDATTLAPTTAYLSQARYQLAATSTDTKVFFAGGLLESGASSDVVDIYDTTSGKWTTSHLSQDRHDLAATSAGNRAFFAGGRTTGGVWSDIVDIYTLQNYDAITSTQAFTLVDQTTVSSRMQLDGGSLNLGSYSLSVGSMSGAAPISLSGQTLTAGSDDTSSTYSGALSGHGGLTKIGAGTLNLSGNSSYDGTTRVSAGTLKVAGSIASSAVVVNGGTLQGTGQVGAITGTSGHLHPGGSPGVLQSGSVTMSPGFDFDVSLDGPTVGTGYSQLAVTGAVNLGGATLEAALGHVPAYYSGGGPPELLFIIQNDGTDPVIGQFAGLPPMSQFGLLYNGTAYEATISYQGNYDTGTLVGGNDVVVALPEPATLSLLALGALAALRRR
jgi:autotransporter-associated beta strand protein